MDTLQQYARAKRSGLSGVTVINNTKSPSNILMALNIIVLLLALAFSAYSVWLVNQKEPQKVVAAQLQDAQNWALNQLHQETLQQYVIDKFFSAKPSPGQRLTMLVCNKEGCKTFKSPDTILPPQ